MFVTCPEDQVEEDEPIAIEKIPVPTPRPTDGPKIKKKLPDPLYRKAGHRASFFLNLFSQPEIDDFFESFRKASRISYYAKRWRTRKKKRKVDIQVSKIPTIEKEGDTYFMCGAQHIRRERAEAWAHPISACMMSAAVQEWRKYFCPDNHPDCRVLIGDATYGYKKPEKWPHNSHREGYCFDVWPMRKNGVGVVDDVKIDQEERYSHTRTKMFVEILRQWGSDTPDGVGEADQFFFNDETLIQLGYATKYPAHDDHIHVCFRPSLENEKRCETAQFDLKICPSLRQ